MPPAAADAFGVTAAARGQGEADADRWDASRPRFLPGLLLAAEGAASSSRPPSDGREKEGKTRYGTENNHVAGE